jgi:NAD-dependent deacetylase
MSPTPTTNDDFATVAQWISQASCVVAFTGAGISTESGIPDFRSPGGLWSRQTPIYYDDFVNSAHARLLYWRQKCEAQRDFGAAQPNIGHQVLAAWESSGQLAAVITQNIDGLHQIAGSRRVHELHGTAREIECIDCGKRFPNEPMMQQFRDSDVVPPCPHCNGRVKSATVLFGQALPPAVFGAAQELSEQCDLFLAIGSSLVVEPAASLPRLAVRQGARLVIVNRDPTPLDAQAALVLRGSIGEVLRGINDRLATA